MPRAIRIRLVSSTDAEISLFDSVTTAMVRPPPRLDSTTGLCFLKRARLAEMMALARAAKGKDDGRIFGKRFDVRWRHQLASAACGDGFMYWPSRPPYVC